MYNFRGVKPERTSWRNERLSRRHRDWGFDLPMVDIDFLAVEYDTAEPVALVEYKEESAKVDLSQANYKVLKRLADKADLPFFVVRYSADLTKWLPTPVNGKAKKILTYLPIFSELEFVEFLYKLRNREVPLNIKQKLITLG